VELLDTTQLADGSVTTVKIAADAVTGAKIADDSIDSEHYVDGSIDTIHIASAQVTADKIATSAVTTAKINADAITSAKIADEQIDSEHYVDGSIDTVHIADSQITVDKMAANSVDSDQYVDGSIDTAHIADSQITSAKIVDGTIVNADINASAAIDATKIHDGSVSNAEFAYVNGVTSAIQTQIDAKAATTYVDNAVAGLRTRIIAECASTANVVISSALEAGDVIDGVTLVAGDRVLLKDQSTATENGLYIAVASGAASRDPEHDTIAELSGSMVVVNQGTVNDNKIFLCTTDTDATLGSTSITYTTITPQNVGTVTSITAGTGLSGGAITSSGTIAIDTATTVDKTTAQTLTNKTLTLPKINEDVALTSTATELNLLDGSTAGTIANSKAVIYSAAGQVNGTTLAIAGTAITSTAAELNLLDGATVTTAELNYSDLATLGTTAASKVFTADANNLTTVSGAVAYVEDTLTDGATITWNVIDSPVAKVTLAGNRTLSAPSGTTPIAGQFVSLLIIQDGTGGRTITWNAVYEFAADTAPTLTATASLGDLFTFRYNGAKWLEVGRNLALTLS
jgi:hypothetical protein